MTRDISGVSIQGQDWARAAETGQIERESGSGGRTRTYDQAVNSRPLYQLSYAGTHARSIGADRGTGGIIGAAQGPVKASRR